MSDRSRSSSPARSRSRSSSRSISRSPSRSRSRSISSSSSSSPRFVSATDSENDRHKSPPLSPKKTKRTKKASPRSSPNEDSDSEQDEPKKKPKRPPPKKKGKAKQESEEGEISSEDNSEFDDGYDDDLIGDDEDRAKLEKMTEREREEILFKRAEDREYAKKQFEIRKKLKQKEKSRAKNESHESQDFDEIDYNNVLDTKERSQTRQKKMEEKKLDQKSSALSELKAKRQEKERKDAERLKKEEAEEERKSRSTKRRSSSSESSSGSERSRRSSTSSRSSSGSGSDTERFKKSPSKVQKYIETQEDMEPIRLSRFKLEKFVHLPFFSKLVMNCFCRIGIGAHQGKSVYRAAEIVDVVETGKVYIVGKQRTNIGLKLKFGKQERVFRLEFISNQHIMPQEFAKWKEACEEANVPLPTIESVKAKSKEIKQAMNYSYTSDDIDKIVAQKEKFQRHPTNYAMTKARLIKEKEIAMANGQDDQANEYERKLVELEERAEELDKRRTATISSVSLVNHRNRNLNLEKAEKALQMEAKKRAEEGSNPFSRKKCNPRMVTKTTVDKQKVDQKENVVKISDTSVTMKRKPEEEQEKSSVDSDKSKKKAKFGSGLPLAMQKEDLFDAHNFDIEIDVNTDNMGVDVSSPAIPAPINIKPTTASGDRKRSLNLDDYKKKRGLI